MEKAILFDMDGVLLDSEPYHYDVDTLAFEEIGINVSEKERASFVGLANDKMWEYLKEKYNLNQPVPELLDLITELKIDYFSKIEGIKPISGIVELLKDLKSRNFKTAIVSSSYKGVIDVFVKRLGFFEYFDVIVSGNDINRGKPNPDIFLLAAKKLNVSPENCIVIEDSVNGVKGAKAAGMLTIGYQNPNSIGQDVSFADVFVNKIEDIDI